jgi:hypothetical protein
MNTEYIYTECLKKLYKFNFINFKKQTGQMLTHCCVGYLKHTNVQNYHHQYHCIVDNGSEESGILLILLLVE